MTTYYPLREHILNLNPEKLPEVVALIRGYVAGAAAHQTRSPASPEPIAEFTDLYGWVYEINTTTNKPPYAWTKQFKAAILVNSLPEGKKDKNLGFLTFPNPEIAIDLEGLIPLLKPFELKAQEGAEVPMVEAFHH